MDGYNGWKNWETWNVALWINNDEHLYANAMRYVRGTRSPRFSGYAAQLAADHSLIGTPDGVNWDAPELDYDALDEMFAGFGEEYWS
jgi:hypothetical protein